MRSSLTEQAYAGLKNIGWLNKMFSALVRAAGYIVGGSKNVGDIILYHGKKVVTLLNVQFFIPVVAGEVGNLTTGLRNEGEPFYISGIRAYSGANAAVNATDRVPGLTTAELQNGTFQIQVNGSNVTGLLPLTMLNGDGTETSQLGYYAFAKPILLPAQQTISVNVSFAVAPATANTSMLFELYGVGALS